MVGYFTLGLVEWNLDAACGEPLKRTENGTQASLEGLVLECQRPCVEVVWFCIVMEVKASRADPRPQERSFAMTGGKYATCRDDLPTLPWRTGLGEFSGDLCAASVFPIFILVLT